MTYCVGMNIDEGLVGLADTAITSGREVTTLRKLTVYSPRNSFRIIERRFEKHHLEQLSRWWDERLRRAVEETPGEWFDQAFDDLDGEPEPPAVAAPQEPVP